MSVGAKDKIAQADAEQAAMDLILENQIEFIAQEIQGQLEEAAHLGGEKVRLFFPFCSRA